MFNASSFFRFLLAIFPKESQKIDYGSGNVQDLINKEKIGILTASCCDHTMQAKDQELLFNLSTAMKNASIERQIVCATITSARQQFQDLGSQVGDDMNSFKESLNGLFQGQGLAAFPMLLIEGKIAFYGGVPSVELISDKLKYKKIE